MEMKISDMMQGAKKVAIFGHVKPDGDCIGSTVGLYNYIVDNYPEVVVKVYLEKFADCFSIIHGVDKVEEYCQEDEEFDTVFVMDASTADRIGAGGLKMVEKCDRSFNIDHHVSNPGNICKVNYIVADASSAAEVLYYMLDADKVSKNCAEALYMGIVHDTGVFKFSATHKSTLLAAADMVDKGVDFPRIINDTYFSRTYKQMVVTGKVMMDAKVILDGKVIYGYVTREMMNEYGVTSLEMDGIIDAIREVEGTEVAIFMYALKGGYKVSLRSKYIVDVNKVAAEFGGGGHVRAAGCFGYGEPEKIVEKLAELIKEQL
ncbi:MAG: bifunctional oligoribonuclease/PAP phosphatase NrnA [Lachnospiraceae bacterium]|nr:bifunctional oligoribonuclease/PAP phosphatase NrnA [Lachnospiraceae bacterium]